MVKRSSARAGDIVVVTGTIGDAVLGLAILHGEFGASKILIRGREAVSRYRVPQPRIVLAQVIRTFASAAMDVSDGLVGDLSKLMPRIGPVRTDIELSKIPLSDLARDMIETGKMPFEGLITLAVTITNCYAPWDRSTLMDCSQRRIAEALR